MFPLFQLDEKYKPDRFNRNWKMYCNRLAQDGCNVCLLGRTKDDLQEVEQECKNFNVNALAIPVDICNQDEAEAAVKRCEDELGGINILVNNGKNTPVDYGLTNSSAQKLTTSIAGVAGLEDSCENWQKTIEVDLMRLTDFLPHIISNIGAGTGV